MVKRQNEQQIIRRTITADDVVMAAKGMARACTAKELAAYIGGTDSRAVATAARTPTDDGRLSRTHHRKQNCANYRFKRMTPKEPRHD